MSKYHGLNGPCMVYTTGKTFHITWPWFPPSTPPHPQLNFLNTCLSADENILDTCLLTKGENYLSAFLFKKPPCPVLNRRHQYHQHHRRRCRRQVINRQGCCVVILIMLLWHGQGKS